MGLSSTLMQGRRNTQAIQIFLLFVFLFLWSFPCLGLALLSLPLTTRSSLYSMEEIINSIIAQKHQVLSPARYVLRRYSLNLYRSANHQICACDWWRTNWMWVDYGTWKVFFMTVVFSFASMMFIMRMDRGNIHGRRPAWKRGRARKSIDRSRDPWKDRRKESFLLIYTFSLLVSAVS